MRFRDIRQTLIKDIHNDADVEGPATPRWVSAFRGGNRLRLGIDAADIQLPVHNRRSRRQNHFKPRRPRGVAIPREHQPWSGSR